MADRDTSAPRDTGGRQQIPSGETEGRRQAPSQAGGGYSQRPQTPPRSGGGYGERGSAPSQSGYSSRQPSSSRSGGGYGERGSAPSQSGYSSRQSSSSRSGGERRSAPSQSGYSSRQPSSSRSGGYGERRPSSRRNDVIRCENCGEDYSVTYKRCPFCDERPGRGGGSGRRVANTRGGGYGRPVNPIQVAGLVISVLLILTAVFIVVRFIGAPLFGGGKKPGNDSSVSTSHSQSSTGSQSAPKPQAVQSIALSESAFDLDSGATHQLTASLVPADATGSIIWSTSDPSAATVDATGLVTNLNSGSANVSVTITASCGEISAEAVVNCKAGGTTTPGGTAVSGSQGVIINADSGLNIRSGPGREYNVVASATNGSTVTILGEENGWYQIRYNGSNTGYVSKDFVSVR